MWQTSPCICLLSLWRDLAFIKFATKSTVSLWNWLPRGLHPWSFSRPGWMKSWTTRSGLIDDTTWSRIWTGWLWSPFQPLVFYEAMMFKRVWTQQQTIWHSEFLHVSSWQQASISGILQCVLELVFLSA